MFEIFHGKNEPHPLCPAVKTLRDRKSHFQEIADNILRVPLLIASSPIFDERGEIVALAHIVKDISDLKRMKIELCKSEEKFRRIFEYSSSIIAIIDENGVFIEANPAAVRSIGTDPVGKNLYELFSEESAQRSMMSIKAVLEQNKPMTVEDDRNGKHFIINLIPIEIEGKKHCLAIANEVTELVRLNRTLNVVSSINKLIAHERDLKKLLEKACHELKSLEVSAVVTCVMKGDILIPIAGDVEVVQIEKCKLIKEAIRLMNAEVRSVEWCKDCMKCRIGFRSVIAIPMRAEDQIMGVLTLHSTREFTDGEVGILQTMANDLALALKTIKLDELKRRAYEQIERNIVQFANIVHFIRTPLTALSGYAELYVKDERGLSKMRKQIERIIEAVRELEKGWMDSEKLLKRS